MVAIKRAQRWSYYLRTVPLSDPPALDGVYRSERGRWQKFEPRAEEFVLVPAVLAGDLDRRVAFCTDLFFDEVDAAAALAAMRQLTATVVRR